jgi:hypothetical protein
MGAPYFVDDEILLRFYQEQLAEAISEANDMFNVDGTPYLLINS